MCWRQGLCRGFVGNLKAQSKPKQTFLYVLLFTGDHQHIQCTGSFAFSTDKFSPACPPLQPILAQEERPPEGCQRKRSRNPAPEVRLPGLLALINPIKFLLCITHGECAGPCSAPPKHPQRVCRTPVWHVYQEIIYKAALTAIHLHHPAGSRVMQIA